MKKISFVFKAMLMLVLIVNLFACSKDDTQSISRNVVKKPAEDPTAIVTQYSYIPLEKNKAYNLSASVIPSEKASEPLEYATDNKSVAVVDDNGTITAYENGIAGIKVNLKNNKSIYKNILVNSYELTDEIKNSEIRAVYVSETFVSLSDNVSNAYKIDASIRPINIVSELIYLSTDENVVTVSDNGTISTKNPGSAAVIVYAKSNPLKYAHISVEVNSSNSTEGSTSFFPPAGIEPIDLNADPFSLIAKYQILDYSIDGGKPVTVDDDSNLRVNVNLGELSSGIVKILMYVKLEGKEVRLIQKKNITDYGSIPEIFTSLGAKITGDYTMEFTLDPVNYTELSKQGLVNKGETLVLNIGKIESLIPASGLGSDIVFDENNVPVESGNGSESGDNETGNSTDVAKILLDKYTYTPYKVNEKFKITATIEPATAENKTITWESSNKEIAVVDKNGEVTVFKNGAADITAKAVNGVKAVLKIVPVTTPEDFMLEIDKQDLILGVIDTFQITPILYPYILDNQNVEVTYSVQNENVATVSNTGLVTAKAEGDTIIDVTIAGIKRQCYINVLPKSAASVPVEKVVLAEESGEYDYSTGSFRLNASVEPSTAGDKRLKYTVADPEICEVNSSGLVTFKNPGTTTITVSAYNDESINSVYTLKVISLPTKVAFERPDLGIVLGEKITLPLTMEGNKPYADIIYTSSDVSIASVDSKTGEVTGNNLGTTTIKAVTENGLEATYELYVYTPADITNLSSLEGTYDIVDFSQANGTLDVGTKDYGGVERMVGEVTIKVEGSQVKMISKIQMNSSKLDGYNSIGSEEAKKGLFQTVVFDAVDFVSGGFGTTGSMTQGQVSAENDLLKIYQQFTMRVVINVTVKVNTWIKKKSNTVKVLDPNVYYWTKDGADYSQNAHATKYFNAQAPDKEPYYTYGLIAK